MTIVDIAILLCIFNLLLLVAVILYLKHSSFSDLDAFAQKQRAMYASLRKSYLNDSAVDARKILALQIDIKNLEDLQKQNTFKFHALDNAFKLNGLNLLSERWNTNLTITRSIDE